MIKRKGIWKIPKNIPAIGSSVAKAAEKLKMVLNIFGSWLTI